MAALGIAVVVAAGACDGEMPAADPSQGGAAGATTSSTSTSSSSSGWTTSKCPNWPECIYPCYDWVVPEDGPCRDCADGKCGFDLDACDDTASGCCTALQCCDSNEWPCYVECLDAAEMDLPEAYGLLDADALFTCLEDRCEDECDAVNLCGTDLGYAGLMRDACISSFCCDAYLPCHDDTDCYDCLLDPEQPGCDTNALRATYLACSAEHCPTELCDTGLGYWQDTTPMLACMSCTQAHCCEALVACVGGVVPDPPAADVDLCIDCLGDPDGPACTDPGIQHAAKWYNACWAAHCEQPCML